MTHEEIAELLGVYALDAVDGEEAEVVRAHLETCPRCADEVRLHRETAAALAYAGESAPEGLWDRIQAQLEETPPPLDMDRIVPPAGRAARRRSATGMRRRATRWTRLAAAGLAAAAAIVIALLSVRVDHLEHKVQTAQSRLPTTPGLVKISLQSPDHSLTVPAVLSPDGDGFVEVGNLPTLPSGRTYQLWAVIAGNRVSLGVLGPRFDVSAFRVSGGKVDLLAITAEDAPGVPASTQVPVVVGEVPRTA
jgi:anti-sigma-K factor RskA